MKKCNEVMTKNPVCCRPDDMVEKVAQLMQSENIGSIPVIENEQTQKLVGIVTDRDLALKVVGEARDSRQTKVEAVLTPDPWTCHEDNSLEDATEIMARHQIRRLPVVNDEGQIVGIIAQADIATRTEDPVQTADVVEQISQPG